MTPEDLAVQDTQWLGGAAPGRDLARFGIAIVTAATFSAVQVFVIPKLLDVTAYGQFRLFLVYVSYVGLLNLGLADGAFVHWAGRLPRSIAHEWRVVLRWLLMVQLAAVVVALVVTIALDDPLTRVFLVALTIAALFINVATLSSYALQACGDFKGAGRVAVLLNGLFVVLVLAVPRHTIHSVLWMYAGAAAVSAGYGASRVYRIGAAGSSARTDDSIGVRALLWLGMPVLGANLAAALSQSIDRIVVSAATPIATFALYGFATTVGVAASTATQALSRVALAHAARWPIEERDAFLHRFYDVIAAGTGIGLLFEPFFERFVAGYLPAYVGAMPIVRALSLGVPFWIATQVVIVGALQSSRRVRGQLALQLTGVLLATAASGIAVTLGMPLWIIGAATSAAAALTFLVGLAWKTRLIPGSRRAEGARFFLLVAAQGVAFAIAHGSSTRWPMQTVIFAALALAPTVVAVRAVRAHGW